MSEIARSFPLECKKMSGENEILRYGPGSGLTLQEIEKQCRGYGHSYQHAIGSGTAVALVDRIRSLESEVDYLITLILKAEQGCRLEAKEWDSDDLIPEKNYADACGDRILNLYDEYLE